MPQQPYQPAESAPAAGLAPRAQLPQDIEAEQSVLAEQRGDKRPMLSDLRESGSIEQDADIVMFIDRSTSEVEAESENRPDMGMAQLIVAKHRNGSLADIDLVFNAEFTKFTDYYDDSRAGGF